MMRPVIMVFIVVLVSLGICPLHAAFESQLEDLALDIKT